MFKTSRKHTTKVCSAYKLLLVVAMVNISLAHSTDRRMFERELPKLELRDNIPSKINNSSPRTKLKAPQGEDRILQLRDFPAHMPLKPDLYEDISSVNARWIMGIFFLILMVFVFIQFLLKKYLGKMLISTMIVFFQAIQIYGVYLFLPVVWRGKTLSIFLGCYSQGEYVRMMKPPLIDLTKVNRIDISYWGKLTVYFNPKFVNFVYPITSIMLVSILVLQGVSFILTKIAKKTNWLKSLDQVLSNLKWFLIEINLVKVLFQVVIGLSEFWKKDGWKGLKRDTLVERVFSTLILCLILGNYITACFRIAKFNKSWFNSENTPSKVSETAVNIFLINKNF
jgi:hypothetical protein